MTNADSYVFQFESVMEMNAIELIGTVLDHPSPYYSFFYKEKFVQPNYKFKLFKSEFKKVSEITLILVRV
jgi:hypothetical protein